MRGPARRSFVTTKSIATGLFRVRQDSKRITEKLLWFAGREKVIGFSIKLQGQNNRYRFRIGKFRVIFSTELSGTTKTINILRIKHRKEIYRLHKVS